MRSPKRNPLSGDILLYQGWHITITRRDGATVHYSAVREADGKSKEAQQHIDEWLAWSKGAKILERAEDVGACLKTTFAAGPCAGCKIYQSKGVHVTPEGIHCGECCTGK